MKKLVIFNLIIFGLYSLVAQSQSSAFAKRRTFAISPAYIFPSTDSSKDYKNREGFTFYKTDPGKTVSEICLLPGYFHFGSKNAKFGAGGISVGYTKYLRPKHGIAVGAGYYLHSGNINGAHVRSGLLTVTGGIIYLLVHPPGGRPGFTVSTHAMAGVCNYMKKTEYAGNNNTTKDNRISLHFNAGVAIDLGLNKKWSIRMLKADYAPSLFYNSVQHNFRASAGIVYNLPG